MTNIILDTNIILRYPKLLGLQIPDTIFLVPLAVFHELNIKAKNRGVQFDIRADLIDQAAKQGTVKIVDTDNIFESLKEDISKNRFSSTDLKILTLAIELQNKGEKVKIATFDNDLQIRAIASNISILNANDLEVLLSNFNLKTRNQASIQNAIKSYERVETRNLVWGAILGALVTLIANFAYFNLDHILKTINIWGTVILILFLGIGLFLLREKQRLSYGFFEFLVGVIAIILLFRNDNFDYSKIKFNLDLNVKLLGGLYIMVRGQDNILTALKDTKAGLFLKTKLGIGK